MSVTDLETQRGLAELVRQTTELALSPDAGWSETGPPGDRLRHAFVSYGDSVFTLLCNDKGRVLVFTAREWDAFLDGVRNGEFDTEAGLTEGSRA
ncbi:Hypothetical protein AJAP_24360 [Amycolatopsis japonica]|uniref:Uncharacterized protein n=2 Tax=Amycolatopsis TaxID=1813 RepID=A0A075UZ35_9PSEU|nr:MULTISPECIES: DUF397 domain-containing protein [Amycolatopsis]AIG77721.1 Hypothetical protein AJAP_24360 [Amycolatopsis japonica]KFU77663.1 hypothetical protein BB31_29940 [Amycolatopsis lurida NRRL 2430]SED13148.1 protein of unknown function [Amycolatopsis lurida]